MSEEIRTLRVDEVEEYINMAGQAFRMQPNEMEKWRRNVDAANLRGLYVDGQLKVALLLHNFQTWVGPETIATSGLAAVASPPENRRKGYMTRLLHAVLAEMREKGIPLSTLYPFYYPFYKKYGWSHSADRIYYKIPTERLPLGRTPGSWHKVYVGASLPTTAPDGGISAADLDVLMGLYDAWSVGRTGMITRDEKWWRRRKLGVERERRPDAYYWRDPNGKPRAYVIYEFEALDTPWNRRMQVELAALDATALRAALEFLRNHDSQAKEVRLSQPEDIRLLAALEDPEFSVEVEAGLMLRLVDVPAAITARRYPPELAAQFTIAVNDPFLDWNHGSFAVTIGDGVATVAPTTSAAAVSLNEKTLAQIYSGYLTPREAQNLGLLTVDDPAGMAAMGRAFAGPRPYICDYF